MPRVASQRQRLSRKALGAPWAVLVIAFHRPCDAFPAERWEVEARLGTAWNAPLPLRLRQEGHEEVEVTAHWRTDAFDQPLYYGVRVAAWTERSGWALDLVHHKLYLDDPPPGVQSLAISHGYNLVTLQRLEARDDLRYGAGLGVVAAHPESEVRGLRFDEHRGILGSGYFIAGGTGEAHVGAVRALGKRFIGSVEARLTGSLASVPIAEGSARVPNLALHLTVGLAFARPDPPGED